MQRNKSQVDERSNALKGGATRGPMVGGACAQMAPTAGSLLLPSMCNRASASLVSTGSRVVRPFPTTESFRGLYTDCETSGPMQFDGSKTKISSWLRLVIQKLSNACSKCGSAPLAAFVHGIFRKKMFMVSHQGGSRGLSKIRKFDRINKERRLETLDTECMYDEQEPHTSNATHEYRDESHTYPCLFEVMTRIVLPPPIQYRRASAREQPQVRRRRPNALPPHTVHGRSIFRRFECHHIIHFLLHRMCAL